MPTEAQSQGSGVAAETKNTGDSNLMESVLRENRLFPPPADFAAKAWIGSEAEYQRLYRRSVEDPEGFWAEAASELEWFQPWSKVIDGEGPSTKWFVGGRLNLSHNCLDRHAKSSRCSGRASPVRFENSPMVSFTRKCRGSRMFSKRRA